MKTAQNPQKIYVSKSNGAAFANKGKAIDFNSPVLVWDRSKYKKVDIENTLFELYELIQTK